MRPVHNGRDPIALRAHGGPVGTGPLKTRRKWSCGNESGLVGVTSWTGWTGLGNCHVHTNRRAWALNRRAGWQSPTWARCTFGTRLLVVIRSRGMSDGRGQEGRLRGPRSPWFVIVMASDK